MKIKKYHGGLKLLLPLLFFIALNTYSGNCKAYSGDIEGVGFNIATDNRICDITNMERIINKLNLGNAISGDYQINLINNYFNLWARTYYAQTQKPFGLQDILFIRNQNGSTSAPGSPYNITIIIMQNGYTDYLHDIYLSGVGTPSENISNTATNCAIREWDGYIYDENSNISGVVANNIDNWSFSFNIANNTGTFSHNNSTPRYYNYINLQSVKQLSGDLTNDGYFVNINTQSMFKMHIQGLTDYCLYDFKGITLRYGYFNGYLNSTLDIVPYSGESSGEITPTPTPTPSGGGGSGTVDYVQGNKDYWGNPEELSGEQQKEQIENSVNEIIENVSGELTQLEVYNQLDDIENGFLNFFIPGQSELFYDLKLEWPDIKYSGETIINAGEINFSKMCREIPILSRIRTTIRAILNFWIVFTLIKQIWNLILATLGIDNPYLYENPEEESINYTYDESAHTLTQNRSVGNYRHIKRWKIW